MSVVVLSTHIEVLRNPRDGQCGSVDACLPTGPKSVRHTDRSVDGAITLIYVLCLRASGNSLGYGIVSQYFVARACWPTGRCSLASACRYQPASHRISQLRCGAFCRDLLTCDNVTCGCAVSTVFTLLNNYYNFVQLTTELHFSDEPHPPPASRTHQIAQ